MHINLRLKRHVKNTPKKIDLTSILGKDIYIKLDNMEMTSITLQEKLFEFDYAWCSSGQKIIDTYMQHISLTKQRTMLKTEMEYNEFKIYHNNSNIKYYTSYEIIDILNGFGEPND